MGIGKREHFPDAIFKASSELEDVSYVYSVHQGRLFGPLAWCPRTTKPEEWLQIEIGTNKSVKTIATRGLDDWQTTSYNLSISEDGKEWISLGQVIGELILRYYSFGDQRFI